VQAQHDIWQQNVDQAGRAAEQEATAPAMGGDGLLTTNEGYALNQIQQQTTYLGGSTAAGVGYGVAAAFGADEETRMNAAAIGNAAMAIAPIAGVVVSGVKQQIAKNAQAPSAMRGPDKTGYFAGEKGNSTAYLYNKGGDAGYRGVEYKNGTPQF